MQIVSKGLGYTYNKGAKFAFKALENVNLTIKDGEFFGIIGHTGSGKSTFVQQLNALLLPMEGELFVGEFDLMKQSKKDKKRFKELRSQVGMVFQYPEYQLFAETVFEDVAFGLKNFNNSLSEQEISSRVREAIEMVGLDFDDIKEKSPFDISGGQKRRVAIAGVLVTSPKVLVLDEPAAGLDPFGKSELWKLLHRVNSNGTTIIVVSHDMNDVAENCQRIAVFDNGTVIAVGTPKQVFDNYNLQECGLEIPVTARLYKALSKLGVSFETDYTVDSFINGFLNNYRNK